MSSYELRRGKYARLDAPADDDLDTPMRFSTDSTGTLEDLEEHDPLAFDSKLQRARRARATSRYGKRRTKMPRLQPHDHSHRDQRQGGGAAGC
jgi:hypothetical protein